MKKLIAGLLLAGALAATGCEYGGVATTADGKQVVVAKNVGFLFGIFNKIYVCNVTPTGLSGCVAGEAP